MDSLSVRIHCTFHILMFTILYFCFGDRIEFLLIPVTLLALIINHEFTPLEVRLYTFSQLSRICQPSAL